MKNNRPAIIASILLLVFLVLGVWLGNAYVAREQQRDMQSWEGRLSVIAESQKRSIESWLTMQISNMQELAENPLLQIMLGIQQDVAGEQSEVQRGQLGYLKNLLIATAGRSKAFSDTKQISANFDNHLDEGVAITDRTGKLLLSTQQFPAGDSHIPEAVALAQQKQRAVVFGIYKNSNQQVRLMFAVPVSAVQANPGDADYRGAVVAVINPQKNLFELLGQHWLTTETDESLLVRGDEFSTEYISPLTGKFDIFHTITRSNTAAAANFARERIGDFAMKTDYRGVQVLVTARLITNTDWVLVQKIDASEALRESRAHHDFILTVFMLAVFIVGISFVAIWRHATSVRLQKTTDRLIARTALLNSVGNNISDHIFLLDKNDNIIFANASLSRAAGTTVDDIKGRTLNHLFNADISVRLLELRRSLSADHMKNRVMEIGFTDTRFIYHISLAALQEGDYRGSVLYVLHDITSLKQAQDKHNRLLEGIIATLVHAVDLHDPHCANHSERTREVAVAIAEAIGLSKERIGALAMAAMLANLGKLSLPRELLTKMQPLNSDEQLQLHRSVLESVNILKDLEFDGPVIEIISQKNEYLDGSGYPKGLKGEAILTESRILSVANAFVAMSSARAYRQGKQVREVLDTLLAEADHQYDRQVVAALFHVAENREDWNRWQVVNQ